MNAKSKYNKNRKDHNRSSCQKDHMGLTLIDILTSQSNIGIFQRGLDVKRVKPISEAMVEVTDK